MPFSRTNAIIAQWLERHRWWSVFIKNLLMCTKKDKE